MQKIPFWTPKYRILNIFPTTGPVLPRTPQSASISTGTELAYTEFQARDLAFMEPSLGPDLDFGRLSCLRDSYRLARYAIYEKQPSGPRYPLRTPSQTPRLR